MGGSRFHSPILTRLAAARCAITVAPGWRWKNRTISGKRSSRRTSSRMSRADREPTRSRWKVRSLDQDCPAQSELTEWESGRAEALNGVPDNFPDAAHVLFGGEDIPEAEAHDDAAAEFRLREVSLAGGIDASHGLAVPFIGGFVVGVLETKTNDAHHHRRRDFKTRVAFDPAGEELSEPQVFPNPRRDSFATERPPDDPGLERAEAAPQLNAVIHVVDLGACGIAQVKVFGDEREKTAQPLDVAHIQRTEIERHEEHFVRVDHERIRLSPAVGDRFMFGQKREAAAVGCV